MKRLRSKANPADDPDYVTKAYFPGVSNVLEIKPDNRKKERQTVKSSPYYVKKCKTNPGRGGCTQSSYKDLKLGKKYQRESQKNLDAQLQSFQRPETNLMKNDAGVEKSKLCGGNGNLGGTIESSFDKQPIDLCQAEMDIRQNSKSIGLLVEEKASNNCNNNSEVPLIRIKQEEVSNEELIRNEMFDIVNYQEKYNICSTLKFELPELNSNNLKPATSPRSPDMSCDYISNASDKNFFSSGNIPNCLPHSEQEESKFFEVQSNLTIIPEEDKLKDSIYEVEVEQQNELESKTTSQYGGHKDSCLRLLLSGENEENQHNTMMNSCTNTSNSSPGLAPMLSVSSLPAQQNFNYLPVTQNFPAGQDFSNLNLAKTNQEMPWIPLGLPTQSPSSVSPDWSTHYLCPSSQLSYNTPLPSYPHPFPLGNPPGRCWNQNVPPTYKQNIQSPNNSFSDLNVMSGPFVKTPQNCYLLHSMLHPSTPYSFLPNQKPFATNLNIQDLPSKSKSYQNVNDLPVSMPCTGPPTSKKLPFTENEMQEDCLLKENSKSQDNFCITILAADVKLIDHHRTKDYFPVFQNHQIPKTVSGSPKVEFILSKYIDFLLLENEGITEISKAFTPATRLFSDEDEYVLDVANKRINFPSIKFVEFMQRHFPDINMQSINFLIGPFHFSSAQKLDTNEKIMQDCFFHFQQLRTRMRENLATY